MCELFLIFVNHAVSTVIDSYFLLRDQFVQNHLEVFVGIFIRTFNSENFGCFFDQLTMFLTTVMMAAVTS